MPKKKTHPGSSFAKAAILGLILVMAFFMYSKISKDGLPRQVFDVFDEGGVDFRKLTRFSEAQKDSIKKAIAGFWVYDTDTVDAMIIHDRIELKDNGIIWQVRKDSLIFDNAETVGIWRIVHAYLNPYAAASKTPGHLFCEVRIIRQVLIHGADTCYGKSFHDEIWEIRADGKNYEMEGLKYALYGKDDLSEFFPAGAINLVDDINVVECKADFSYLSIVRAAIINAAKSDTAAHRDSARIFALVDRYYAPFCLRPALDSPMNPKDSTGVSLQLRFAITPEGTPINVRVKAGTITFSQQLTERAAAEIQKWRFYPVDNPKADTLSFSYNAYF